MSNETSNKINRFNQQIFTKKRNQYYQRYRQNKFIKATTLSEGVRPRNHPTFRRGVVLSIIFVGLYFCNQKYRVYQQFTQQLQNYSFDPINKATFYALLRDFQRRLQAMMTSGFSLQNKHSSFANIYFESQLTILYQSIKLKTQPHNFSHELIHGIQFGPFNINNKYFKIFINQSGHLIFKKQFSKFQIFNLKFFGSVSQDILAFQTYYHFFYHHQDNFQIRNKCNIINVINKLLLPSSEYQILLTECINKSTNVIKKSMKLIEQSKKKVQKKKPQIYLIKF